MVKVRNFNSITLTCHCTHNFDLYDVKMVAFCSRNIKFSQYQFSPHGELILGTYNLRNMVGWKSTPLSNKPEVVRKKSFIKFQSEWFILLFIWFGTVNKTPFPTIFVRSGFWGGNPPLCPIWSMKFQMIYKNVSNARMTCQGDCWRFLWRNIHARIVLTFENGAFSGFGVENHPFVQYVGTGRNDENRSGGHKTELYVIFPLFQHCIDAFKQNLQVWKGLGWFSTPLAPNTLIFEGWDL